MKTFFSLTTALLTIILLVCVWSEVHAQFPARITLNAASGDVKTSPQTMIGKKYRITVQGQYSQWTGFSDCHGVDAVWVYDVPQEEYDNFKFPPKSILGQPFVSIPHWVGDTTLYAFPPKQLGLTPLFELSFRKYLGFRIDGSPLPQFAIDKVTHRYQTEKAGTGQPFQFQILDSTYNLALQRALPRYEDNCGALNVTIEEIQDDEINICGVEQIVRNNEVIGLKLDASILRIDSNSVSGVRNILRDQTQLGICVDGKFICPDSIVCKTDRTKPISIGLVIDRSGSMNDYLSGTTTRMDATKNSVTKFLRKLQPLDEAFISSFSSSSTLNQDWTKDTKLLEDNLKQISPSGSTAFYDALIQGLRKVSINPNPNKALIALTDGVNNEQPFDSSKVISEIQFSGVPLYLVALNLGNNKEEQIALDNMRAFVHASPKGRFYSVSNTSALDSLYTQLSNEIGADECCSIYFKIPPCDPSKGNKQTLSIVYVSGDSIHTRKLEYSCKTGGITFVDDNPRESHNGIDAGITPNPFNDIARIWYTIPYSGYTTVMITDMLGVSSKVIVQEDKQTGHYTIDTTTLNLSSGSYQIVVSVNGKSISRTIVVVK